MNSHTRWTGKMPGAVDFRLRPPLPSVLNTFLYKSVDDLTSRAGARDMAAPKALTSHKLSDVLSEMDDAGVEVGVVPARLGSERMGEISNDEVAQVMRDASGRFAGFAAPHPDSIDSFCDSLASLIASGFSGVNLEPGTWTVPRYADDPALDPVYERCAELGVPVMIMAGGNAGPDISYTDPVHLDHVLARHPRVALIAAHGGWPWVNQILHLAYRHPNLYVSPDSYLFGMAGWRDYLDAGNGFLADRMLFGTAFPILPLKSSMDWVREHFRPEVIDGLLYGNAQRIMNHRGREGAAEISLNGPRA